MGGKKISFGYSQIMYLPFHYFLIIFYFRIPSLKYCGDTEDYCGEGCQSNCNVNKPGSFDSVFQNKGQFQLAVDFE